MPASLSRLHQQMRLAVGQAARHRGADAGADLGVEHVGVERNVDRRQRAEAGDRLLGDPRQAEPATSFIV